MSVEIASVGKDWLVAAGVVLCGNQHQARAYRDSLGLGRTAERVQDAKYQSIRGKHSKAHGGDDREEKN